MLTSQPCYKLQLEFVPSARKTLEPVHRTVPASELLPVQWTALSPGFQLDRRLSDYPGTEAVQQQTYLVKAVSAEQDLLTKDCVDW